MPYMNNLFSHIPVRTPYLSELSYFNDNPHVAGMAAEDDAVILNPYSQLSEEQRNAVLLNERARIFMRQGGLKPDFNLTDKQKEAFSQYSNDETDIKHTLASRILSGDQSALDVTPEQQIWVYKNLIQPFTENQRYSW